MKKYILSICTLAAVCLGSVAVTSCSEPDDINDLVLNRVLSPTGTYFTGSKHHCQLE